MRRRISWLALLAFSVLLMSCETMSTGVTSRGDRASAGSGGIEVLLLSYDEALELALQIGQESFAEARMTDRETVLIFNQSALRGNARAEIEARLVENLGGSGEIGVVYKLYARGYGRNSALNPGYINGMFFSRLAEKQNAGTIPTAWFARYKTITDRGVAENIGDSIPATYDGFKRYIDGKKERREFEGIWTDLDGKYTLGLVYDPRDPRFRYKAFVIESRQKNWKPGEIKFKVNKLAVGGLAVGPYFGIEKNESGVTWKVESNLVTAINEPGLIYFMIYPESFGGETREGSAAVGTGWAITSDGHFVTNAHVVDGAKKIFIGFREGNPLRAKVVTVDQRTDLAVLKIVSPDRKFVPLPLAIGKTASNGSAITVIGYPLAFTLGDDPRVTDGIVSAQSGDKKDVTRYQISAPITHGNSGGPVIDSSGAVIGIAVSGTRRNDAENINFAVKSSYLKLLLDGAGVRYRKGGGGHMSPRDIFAKYGKSVLPVWIEY